MGSENIAFYPLVRSELRAVWTAPALSPLGSGRGAGIFPEDAPHSLLSWDRLPASYPSHRHWEASPSSFTSSETSSSFVATAPLICGERSPSPGSSAQGQLSCKQVPPRC